MGRHKLSRYAAKFGNHPKIGEAAAALPDNGGYWAADILRRFDMMFQTANYRAAFFDALDAPTLASYMSYPPPLSEPFQILHSMNILPTPAAFSLAQQGESGSIAAARTAIQSGNFDPTNPLHVELEYSGYRLGDHNGAYRPVITLPEFRQLPWIEGLDVVLTDSVYADIERTAQEAADVLKFALGKRGEVPLLVIVNKRYGSYFVVGPIEDQLTEAGIQVKHEYVSSFDFGDRRQWLGVSLNSSSVVDSSEPNIIVVDGTKNCEQSGMTRFPTSFLGYAGAIHGHNAGSHEHTYKISFWAPSMTEEFFVGKEKFRMSEMYGDREAIMVCSASTSYKGGSGAAFDDPEDYIKQSAFVFTVNGLTTRSIASDPAAFTRVVQAEIKKRVGVYL